MRVVQQIHSLHECELSVILIEQSYIKHVQMYPWANSNIKTKNYYV